MSTSPLLILIRGLPGSGKSYLAEALCRQLGEETVSLDPDAVDLDSAAYAAHVAQLTAEGVDSKLHQYRFLRAQAYSGIEAGRTIVWNQPFTNIEIMHKMLTGLKDYAVQHGTELRVLVVEVEADPSTAKERVTARKAGGGHGPSDATFKRFTNDYTTFAGQGYPTVTVYGQHDVRESVDTVLSAVRELAA